MTLQELADIAMRHATAMADALLAAVLRRAYETGEPVEIAQRKRQPRGSVRYDGARDPFHEEALECMRQTHGVDGL